MKVLSQSILSKADFVEVKSTVSVCRDPKDNFLFALCQKGKVDFPISGDKDVLVLKTFKNTSILLMKKFLENL